HRRLIETIQSLRCIWSGEKNFEGEFISFRNLEAVVEPNSSLPIVVGANGLEMIQLASEYADGVNIRVGPSTEKMIRRAVALAPSNEFEISVHENLDLSHPLGGEIDKWLELGVRRRACMISTPFDLETVSQIGAHLQKI
ncbi:MAG TPA: LLM class flavin-dependent oxidoreductase, partial [Acidimicrobiales bacterium]|nr:LLM class flavin-dependent oxidoreductase [Acidimicrobiales bacterium]